MPVILNMLRLSHPSAPGGESRLKATNDTPLSLPGERVSALCRAAPREEGIWRGWNLAPRSLVLKVASLRH